MIALTKLRLINVLMVLFAFTTLASGQYFSPHYSSYARNGKRSYMAKLIQYQPSSDLSKEKSSPDALAAADRLKSYQPVPKSASNFYQSDKLSFRKSFNKFGKRNEAQEAALKEIISDNSPISEYMLQAELNNVLDNYLNSDISSTQERKRRIIELIQLLSNADENDSASDE